METPGSASKRKRVDTLIGLVHEKAVTAGYTRWQVKRLAVYQALWSRHMARSRRSWDQAVRKD